MNWIAIKNLSAGSILQTSADTSRADFENFCLKPAMEKRGIIKETDQSNR